MAKNIHVVKHGNHWETKIEGNSTPLSKHHTQGNAIDKGREFAIDLKSELVIHRPNGLIRDKNSYGNDPYPPKG